MASIYVAGASKELDRARRVMAMLREAGHEITCDWTEPVSKYGSIPRTTGDAVRAIDEDLLGIQDAEVFVFLHPAPGVPTTGAWFELGYAAASLSNHIIIAYENRETRYQTPVCLFTMSPDMAEDKVYDADILRRLSELDL